MPMKDLTGMRFGKLVAIEPAGKNKFGNYQWLCKCDCGSEIIALSGNLLKGNTKSCGCIQKNDLTGNRYGKLVVVERLDTDSHGDTMYLCRCDCGNEIIAKQSNLVKGHYESCGQYGCKKTNKTHGMYQSDLYNKYYCIHTRCKNKSNRLYGGRGISVCEEWSGPNGFIAFMKWSMEHGYKEGLSIDRIDVNGDYCPENCRWIPLKYQQRNKRTNHMITYDGETKPAVEWGEITGISPYTILNRIKRGWTAERALTEPVHAKHRRKVI